VNAGAAPDPCLPPAPQERPAALSLCGLEGGGHYGVMMDHEPSDSVLLARYAGAGDEAAFAELVRRHLGLVYHVAVRQTGGQAHVAEEVAQVVFTRLARKAGALAGHQALAGWLHTATRHVAHETLRAERRRRAREQEVAIMEENPERGHGGGAVWAELRPVIDEALGALDERDREAVLLRYFAGLSHAAVGARLAVSENAARMRVERALEKLQVQLARRGVTSTAAALGGSPGRAGGRGRAGRIWRAA
jgi:RNA polymerase sigma factor (sigma-70 family)